MSTTQYIGCEMLDMLYYVLKVPNFYRQFPLGRLIDTTKSDINGVNICFPSR